MEREKEQKGRVEEGSPPNFCAPFRAPCRLHAISFPGLFPSKFCGKSPGNEVGLHAPPALSEWKRLLRRLMLSSRAFSGADDSEDELQRVSTSKIVARNIATLMSIKITFFYQSTRLRATIATCIHIHYV